MLLIAPRPVIRHDRRGGVLARSCGAFHVRTPWYNSPSLLIQSLIASPACPVAAPYPSIMGASPSIGSDYGGWLLRLLSARLSICPLRSVPIRPAQSTRGTGRTTGRVACLMGRSRSRLVRLSLRLRRVWNGDGDCVYRMGAFNCLPAILRLPGNTSAVNAGRHRVGSRSGSIVSPPASYPLLFRILCPIATSRCPVPSHPSRSPACLALIATLIAPCSFPPINMRNVSAVFLPPPTAYRPSLPACRVE